MAAPFAIQYGPAASAFTHCWRQAICAESSLVPCWGIWLPAGGCVCSHLSNM